MPTNILPYFKCILQLNRITATFIQRSEGYSHDKLTRMLNQEISWKRAYFLLVLHRLLGGLRGGYLIIDDTVLAKPFGKTFAKASWIYSSAKDEVVFGYNIVFICWSKGLLTIPLAWKWYEKGGKSKVDLALELLDEVKRYWKISPEYVLFDSWYASSRILDHLNSLGWKFVTQLKKNRLINGISPKKLFTTTKRGKDQIVQGYITPTKSFMVTILKHEKKLFATNDPSVDILKVYGERWAIEEMFRFLKTSLNLEKCQAITKTSQEKHLLICILGYLVLSKEQQIIKEPASLYAIKELWVLNRKVSSNRIRHYSKILVSVA